MINKYLKYLTYGFFTLILVLSGIFYLSKISFWADKTKEAVGQETNYQVPLSSVKSYGYYLMPYTRFGEYGEGKFPDYSAEDVKDFWLSKHDLIVTGYSPQDYKEQEANRLILGGDANTGAGFYDYSSNTYYWEGQWTDLYNWIENNFDNYNGWGFNSVDEAFEDCWLHLSETSDPITFTFGGREDRYGTTEITITPYDPADPTRSRVPGAWDASSWYTNIKSPVYIDFWQDYYTEQLIIKYEENVDGYFLDVLSWDGYAHFSTEEEFQNLREFSSREEYNTYLANLTEIIQNKLHETYLGKYLAANTWRHLDNSYEEPTFTFKDNVDIYIREGSIHSGMNINSFENELKACLDASNEGHIVLRQHRLEDGNASIADISRIAGLATYYLSKNENTYFFSYPVVNSLDIDPYNAWYDAIGYDIGQPEGDYYVFAEGIDGNNYNYKIFARNFTKAMVLIKPPHVGYNLSENSRTTHLLPGTFKSLDADANLGPKITEISLRNWEGAILLEVDTIVPGTIDDLKAT
ncbi:MAG: hypothetical protein U5L76_04115 [Patescibacteria group bacterium]|nr:hypothetical protein [Patescibacteria group bacterium]